MSDPDRPTVLVAAFSARQIAESARLAGLGALALDFFGDSDLAEAARRSEVLHGHYPDGFDAEALIAALERLADGVAPLGFVYGAGFEDRPELLEAIGERWPILGTAPATQRRLKDPESFAELCAAAGVAHPPIRRDAPADPANWLSKKVGGAGGSHVVPGEHPPAPDRYYQRRVDGARISLAFVAAGTRCAFLGFTRQWTAPSAAEPYRYGGAVGPLPGPVTEGDAMQAAVAAMLAQLPLDGIASADFVLSSDGPVLLEINARAGATLDVFESPAQPLLALHLAACRGELPERVSGPGLIRATGLAWADSDIELPAGFAWPAFSRDRTTPPASFAAGQPLCTVVAEADTEKAATALFDQRVAAMTERLGRRAA
ncbi:ATP-grasp domain-containing protein [Aurantimonas sp. HBX-1]|uniref:ATP-grasp domain-containing protein n=1 Tax=Aurantimonas sp. HBX-1 TaxID=2906072 RepID=UPI001F260921|nr:ATP-grasp domain-containing protein [Aurantimonas sp. HBX-1]UIJ72274.1 ATP-grasp domain-containing protein [Aurantimonas sp. HBX-1]